VLWKSILQPWLNLAMLAAQRLEDGILFDM
jgi:hypothetical protein